MLWKCCTQYASKFGILCSGWRTGTGKFSFQSQRKAMPKNAQITAQLHSSQSVQLVTQLCPTLCNSMDCSTPGFPVHHQLPGFTQTMSIESVMPPNHFIPLSSPSPPTFNLSQYQGLLKWVSSLHQVAKVLEFQLQHQSFQWTPRTDLL